MDAKVSLKNFSLNMRKLKNEELGRVDVSTYKSLQKNPIVIVLDNVRSMHNVGSAFRTADAFLIEKIYLCGITAKPPHREINKTAIGATDSVDWFYEKETSTAVEDLRRSGYKIISIEHADKSKDLSGFMPESLEKYALIFGNEVFGIKDEVVQYSDEVVEIPQFGTKHSLNISVSVGVVVWDFLTKMDLVNR